MFIVYRSLNLPKSSIPSSKKKLLDIIADMIEYKDWQVLRQKNEEPNTEKAQKFQHIF